MKAIREAIDTVTTLRVPLNFDALAPDEEWLPSPLTPLLRTLLEERGSPEAMILHAPRFFEASYRFLAALTVPVVIRHGTLNAALAGLVGALLGTTPPGVVSISAKVSLGGYKDLFIESLRAGLAQRSALERLPGFLRRYVAPSELDEVRRLHDSFVLLRNATHHKSALTTFGAPAFAAAFERATLWWVAELEPLREYEVVVSPPAAVVAANGALRPYQGTELPKSTRRYGAMLVHRDNRGQVREAFQLPPFVSYLTDDHEARAQFLSPTTGGADRTRTLAGRPPADEASKEDLTGFAQRELLELVRILSFRGQRDEAARVESWSDALNPPFAGFARFLATPKDAPEPFELGTYQPPPEVARRADELRPSVAVNDPHAIIDRGMTRIFGSDTPDFERTDYAVVKALREAGECPALLSAQAVIVSTERRALLVHFRDAKSATYPRCFHTIGGAFQPSDGRVGDVSIEDTIFREVQEETQIRIIPNTWPVIATEESTTGFIQYVFLGVRTKTQKFRENWEGRLRWLSFDALEHQLTREKRWVPSGKLHLLLWLAAGAPGAPGARFADRDAQGLLRVVLQQAEHDGTLPFWRDPGPRAT